MAYNITTLEYHDDGKGLGQKYADDMGECVQCTVWEEEEEREGDSVTSSSHDGMGWDAR